MEQNKVTRAENPVTRATSAINKALEGLGMANQAMSQKGPTTGQALAQALTQPMGDTPKQQQQAQTPEPTTPAHKPFEFDWPGARAHIMEQAKAELEAINAAPFMDTDYPKLTAALLFIVAKELSVLNRRLGPGAKVPKKSPIIRP